MEHRIFELHRDEDPTGVSGTGVVAEGVQFSSGVIALEWLSDTPSCNIYRGNEERGISPLDSIELLHGHDGKTRIVWDDEDEDKPSSN